jgi:hypothetical protein
MNPLRDAGLAEKTGSQDPYRVPCPSGRGQMQVCSWGIMNDGYYINVIIKGGPGKPECEIKKGQDLVW